MSTQSDDGRRYALVTVEQLTCPQDAWRLLDNAEPVIVHGSAELGRRMAEIHQSGRSGMFFFIDMPDGDRS